LRCPDNQAASITVEGMHIVEASEDMTAVLGEDLDSLCSLLPVRWGPFDVLVRHIAIDDERPVGQVTVLKNSLSPETRALLTKHGIEHESLAECADLVVRASYRNRGVGRELLESVIRSAHSKGIRLVAFVTGDNTEARSTFLARGWVEWDIPYNGSVLLGPDVTR
jgi:GNAT superfamily N-acetyltransferase